MPSQDAQYASRKVFCLALVGVAAKSAELPPEQTKAPLCQLPKVLAPSSKIERENSDCSGPRRPMFFSPSSILDISVRNV